LTYDIPPKTSLNGIIGSILGYERKSNEMTNLSNIKIGLSILNPVKKIHQGINWLNTKVKSIKISSEISSFLEPISDFSVKDFYGFVGLNKNKPSNLQLLKKPKFRIYILDEGFEDYNVLVNSIKKQLYHFSPYFGQSEFLCSVKYKDEIDPEEIQQKDGDDKVPINSITPQSFINKSNEEYEIEISEESSIIVEQIPLKYEDNITKFHKIVYDKTGNSLSVSVKKYYKVASSSLKDDFNVILF
jgi:CRISPR-associated protein Cas5h